MYDRLCLWVKWLHAGLCTIRDVHEREVALIPNRTQRIIIATMLTQASYDQPIRLVILKARKTGVSTLIQSLFIFICQAYTNQISLMLAHLGKATEEIFEIGRLMAKSFPLLGGGDDIQKVGMHGMRFGKSRALCHTAGSGGVGAGGTPNMLHLSEVALWRLHKIETEYAASNSVPPTVSTTCIVYESTARGRDLFWNRFETARSGVSRYAAVFVPWYFDERNRMDVSEPLILDDDERVLVRLAASQGIELGHDQLEWRRQLILDTSPMIFRQEYPSTPEEAVAGARGQVLPGLADCVVDEFPYDLQELRGDNLIGGWDYGYIDPTALITGAWIDQVLWVLDLYHASGKLADEYATEVMDGCHYSCDPSARGPREELAASCRHMKIQATFGPAPRRATSKHSTIVKDEWEIVAKLIRDGRLRILKGPAADRLCMESDNFFWHEKTGEPDTPRSAIWGHFDTLDALRYMAMGATRGGGRIKPRERRESVRAGLRR